MAFLGVVVVGAALLLGCTGGSVIPPGDPARPDVILVSIDSLRPDHLGSYGSKRAPSASPFLDQLGAEGVRFTEARTVSPWTLPSHVTMLSGRPPLDHGVVEDDRRIPEDLPMIQEAMRTHGYATAGFVSTIYVSEPYGFARGFDRFDDFGIQKAANLQHTVRAETLVDAATAWAETQPNKPIFLFVHLYDVHYPYLPPEPWNLRYDRAGTRKSMRYHSYERSLQTRIKPERWAHLSAQYDERLAYADDQLKRLHSAWGARAATWIVTADHGEELGEHGGWGHAHTLFPEVMRVPLLISGAGVPTPSVRDDRVGVLDVPATVAALGGVAFESAGVNVLGVVPPKRDQVFDTSRFKSARLGLLTGDARVDLDFAHGTQAWYDEVRDPGEDSALPGMESTLVSKAWAAVGERWVASGSVISPGWIFAVGAFRDHAWEGSGPFALFPPDATVSGPAARATALPPTVSLSDDMRAQLKALGYEQ